MFSRPVENRRRLGKRRRALLESTSLRNTQPRLTPVIGRESVGSWLSLYTKSMGVDLLMPLKTHLGRWTIVLVRCLLKCFGRHVPQCGMKAAAVVVFLD